MASAAAPALTKMRRLKANIPDFMSVPPVETLIARPRRSLRYGTMPVTGGTVLHRKERPMPRLVTWIVIILVVIISNGNESQPAPHAIDQSE